MHRTDNTDYEQILTKYKADADTKLDTFYN